MVIKAIKSEMLDKAQLIKSIINTIGTIDVTRIQQLINDFIDTVTFVTEFPYTDKHYRDSYNLFYSSKFSDFKKSCMRIHIFKTPLKIYKDFETNRDDYCGYFIIRPLEQYPLGRSMINPRILKKNNFVTCLSKEIIHFLGTRIEISGFPHVAQDTQTHSCAESSLWALITYFGQKYIDYKPLLPSEIIKKVGLLSNHRILPSRGLTVDELTGCLNGSGQNCLLYFFSTNQASNIYSILNIYIESGMPLIATLTNNENGHAVLVTGHGNTDFIDIKTNLLALNDIWKDVSFYKKDLVLIDDNKTPFDLVPINNPAIHYDPPFNTMNLSAIIVPFHKDMFLDAQSVYGLVSTIFDDKDFGLKKFGGKWIIRLYLTSSNSYKEFLNTKSIVNNNIKRLLLLTSMPKFIWICELYRLDDYEKQKTSGILFIDATGDTSLNSIIYYFLEDNRFITKDAFSWQGLQSMIKYQDVPYQNNLKGEWNSWRN